MPETAIIGGTGVYNLSRETREEVVATPYGEVVVELQTIEDKEIVFLPRHGKKHTTPPHRINYRANMWALKELGVKYIYATGAVGSCEEKFKPGQVVLLTDFLDFTRSRPLTFYDEEVVHTSMADPYCSNLRRILKEEALKEGLPLAGEGVYVCTEGPRFETAAEIRLYQQLGGHVVGMTNVPEVVLAKELKMCYAAVGIITNWCTGLGEEMDVAGILAAVDQNKEALTRLFIKIFTTRELSQKDCQCRQALMKL